MKKNRKVEKKSNFEKKKNKNKKKKEKVTKTKRKKKKKSTVNYCCNPQCFVCGKTVISPHHLGYVVMDNLRIIFTRRFIFTLSLVLMSTHPSKFSNKVFEIIYVKKLIKFPNIYIYICSAS
jgi:hypothetical protein